MTMNEKDFLNMLTRAVRLAKETHIYNTNYISFMYSLSEKKGTLALTMSFPNPKNCVTVYYDSNSPDDAEKLLSDVERFIKEKREYVLSRYNL